MDNIINNINKYRDKINRPIKESSMKTYVTSLKRIFALVKGKSYIIKSLDIFLDYKNVIKIIEENKLTVSVKKKIINAILVALTDEKKYADSKTKFNEYRLKIQEEINKKYQIQTKTEKEVDNWVTLNDLNNVVKEVKNRFEFFKKKFTGIFNDKEKKLLTDYIITQLYLCDIKYHPPRRNIYCTFNIVTNDIYEKKYKDDENKIY